MITRRLCKFLDAAERIAQTTAKDDHSIGYLARGMIQASMPHRDTKSTVFCRKNGNIALTMTAINPNLGLPFGTIPRLLMAWVGREVMLTENRNITLGDNLADFLNELDLYRTGGVRGDITRLKDQAARLFSAVVCLSYNDNTEKSSKNLLVADEYCLWNEFIEESSGKHWRSSVTLSQTFFDEIVKSPVPLDIRVFKALKSSPLAIDIYSWLSYRYSYLRRQSPPIPWPCLQMQFGADYKRTRDFRCAFVEALQKVKIVYPAAKYSVSAKGVTLYPSPPHIARR